MNANNKKYEVNSLEISSVNSILHTINSLQGCIKNLLEITPDLNEFENIKKQFGESDLRNALVNTDQMKLAILLKNLYNSSKLDIFDQLLDYRSLIDRNIEKNIKLEIGQNLLEKRQNSTGSSINGLSCEDFMEFSHFMQNSNSTPPLIRIKNDELRQRVFTHKSVTNTLSSSLGSNEKLEFLGDSALYFLISNILFFWFPSYDEGDMTNLRASLVLNAQLNKWSLMYKLDERLMYDYGSNALDNESKVLADVFEAYIGALVIENDSSYEEILFFLKRLIFPIVEAHISMKNLTSKKEDRGEEDTKQTSESDLKSKNIVKDEGTNYIKNLYALVGMAACPPEYEIVKKEKVNQHFKVHCIVTLRGDILGRGVGSNAKLARREAAKDAMLNHKDLVDKHFKIRSNIPRAESVVSHKDDSPRLNDSDRENPLINNNNLGKLNDIGRTTNLLMNNNYTNQKPVESKGLQSNLIFAERDTNPSSSHYKMKNSKNKNNDNTFYNKRDSLNQTTHPKSSKKSISGKKPYGSRSKK